MSDRPRPLFIYGTLCAMPLLAWALTGEASNATTITKLTRRARVHGYARYSLHNRDYPAVIKQNGSSVDGYLVTLETASQRRKLDDFEGETYRVTPVLVEVLDTDGNPCETVAADMYLWNGESELVSTEPWELAAFIEQRLNDWIDLFEGMELTGAE